jgi:hypothetical protein
MEKTILERTKDFKEMEWYQIDRSKEIYTKFLIIHIQKKVHNNEASL